MPRTVIPTISPIIIPPRSIPMMPAIIVIIREIPCPISPKPITKKIISTAVNIANGSKEKLILGDLNISRDWGWAQEYIKAMWLMLQQKKAEDFVIATGETNSLKNFVKEVFNQFNLDWKKYVVQDKKLFRPQDIIYSKADPKKALKKLNWKAKFKMNDITKLMIKANNIK